MALADIASLSSAISGVAVVASLVFLYFQVRQVGDQLKLAEKSARAVIAQERTNRISDIQMQVAQDASLAEAVEKGMAGAGDITGTQLAQFRNYSFARFLNSEDSFFQHRSGLLSDEAFATFERTYRMAFRSAGARVLWKWARAGYDPEFVAFTDKIVAQAVVGQAADDLARWKTDIAAEREAPAAEGRA